MIQFSTYGKSNRLLNVFFYLSYHLNSESRFLLLETKLRQLSRCPADTWSKMSVTIHLLKRLEDPSSNPRMFMKNHVQWHVHASLCWRGRQVGPEAPSLEAQVQPEIQATKVDGD